MKDMEKKQNNYYVYEWIRLDTNEPFYVGKGKGNRWKDLDRKYNPYFINIVNKTRVAVNILHDNLNEEVAYGLEVYYIWLYRDEIGYNLTNINDGGEGNSLCGELNGMYGKSYKEFMSEDAIKEHNRKISEALKGENHADVKGENNPMYGKNPWDYMSEETKERTREKLRKSSSGKNNGMYGKTHNEESRRKMSENKKGKRKGKDNPNKKSVICLTTKRIFFTIREASDYYKCISTHISACCKNKRKHCGKHDGKNLKWKYLIWNHDKKYRKRK